MKKNIRQHISSISDIEQLLQLQKELNAFKTYLGSRYNGINSICLLSNHRKLIRDKLIGTDIVKNTKLQGRHWKTCIDNVISNIKTNWELCKQDIRFAITNNGNLSDEDRYYLRYILEIDKGYTCMLETSTDHSYGDNLSKLLTKETERLSEKNKVRNKIRQQIKTLEKNGELAKAERIKKNNFGNKKYIRQKRKHNENIKCYINHSINQMLDNEKPKEIVLEDLTWSSKKDYLIRILIEN